MDRTIESQRPVVLPVGDNENVNAANRQLLEREGYAAPTLIEASLARDAPRWCCWASTCRTATD